MNSINKKDVSGIILAGGVGKRFGKEKSNIILGDFTILKILIKTLSLVFSEIIIVTREDQQLFFPDVQIESDIFPGKGSLGGLYTGLVKSSNPYNFVCACDMPFISKDVIHILLKEINNEDAVVPKINGHFEPLSAVYSKTCIDIIRTSIETNHLKIIDLFDKFNFKQIDDCEFRRIDPNLYSFFNINTKEDYQQAKTIFSSYY